MAENALAAALLKMAAEHRLKAESARNMMSPVTDGFTPTWRSWLKEMNRELERDASEQDGLAEVYERFAHRIISEAMDQLIMEQMQRLSGHAQLLEIEPEPSVFNVWGRDTALGIPWHFQYYQPPPPPPFTILGGF